MPLRSATPELNSLKRSLSERLYTAWREHAEANTLKTEGNLETALAAVFRIDEVIRNRLLYQADTQQETTIWVISQAACHSEAAQRHLLAYLTLPDSYLRSLVIAMMYRIGPYLTEPVVTEFLELMMGTDADARKAAAKVLRGVESIRQEKIWKPIVTLLNRPEEEVRIDAATALQALGTAMPEEVRARLRALLDQQASRWNECGVIADTLGRLGDAMPKDVQHALLNRLMQEQKDGNIQNIEALAQALGAASASWSQYIRDAISGHLRSDNEPCRQAVLRILCSRGAAQDPDIQAWLISYIQEDAHTPMTLVLALRVLRKSEIAWPNGLHTALVTLLDHKQKAVRREVIKTIHAMPTPLPATVQRALMTRLAHPDPQTRQDAVETIKGLGHALPISMRQHLLDILASSCNTDEKQAVVRALERVAGSLQDDERRKLLHYLDDDTLGDLVRKIAQRMGQHMPDSTRQELSAWLQTGPESAREAAAIHLAEHAWFHPHNSCLAAHWKNQPAAVAYALHRLPRASYDCLYLYPGSPPFFRAAAKQARLQTSLYQVKCLPKEHTEWVHEDRLRRDNPHARAFDPEQAVLFTCGQCKRLAPGYVVACSKE